MLAGSGNLHGILNKGMGAVSPFLVGGKSTRRPYLPVSDDLIEQFGRIVEEQFQDLVWTPLPDKPKPDRTYRIHRIGMSRLRPVFILSTCFRSTRRATWTAR